MASPKEGEAKGGPPGQPGQQVINLNLLELPQLQQLKNQVEQELNFYQEAVVQLKDVQVKMNDSKTALQKVKVNQDKKDILVPVTGSMFVRGQLSDLNKMLIDIGTGYFVEKSLDDAVDYFERKTKFLQTQIEKVQNAGREKTQIRAAIVDIMEAKVKVLRDSGKLVPAGSAAASAAVK